VARLKDIVDDLDRMTKYMGIDERQRELISCEIESILEIPMLRPLRRRGRGALMPWLLRACSSGDWEIGMLLASAR
jgi:hypothetical protein